MFNASAAPPSWSSDIPILTFPAQFYRNENAASNFIVL